MEMCENHELVAISLNVWEGTCHFESILLGQCNIISPHSEASGKSHLSRVFGSDTQV